MHIHSWQGGLGLHFGTCQIPPSILTSTSESYLWKFCLAQFVGCWMPSTSGFSTGFAWLHCQGYGQHFLNFFTRDSPLPLCFRRCRCSTLVDIPWPIVLTLKDLHDAKVVYNISQWHCNSILSVFLVYRNVSMISLRNSAYVKQMSQKLVQGGCVTKTSFKAVGGKREERQSCIIAAHCVCSSIGGNEGGTDVWLPSNVRSILGCRFRNLQALPNHAQPTSFHCSTDIKIRWLP